LSVEHVPSSPPAARLLVVDDDEGLLFLMADTLRTEGYEVSTAVSAKGARACLEREPPELMLLDLKLQDGSGPELVADLQRASNPVPFIVVTGQGDEKVAVEVMKQGALDYVMKDTGLLDLLPAVVKRALKAVHQAQALQAAQSEHQRLESEILAAGQRERHRIGADLHDNLGQQLTAMELMCTALKEDAARHPALTKGLERMGRMLREAVAQTRALARGLVPVGTDPEALQNGLAELVEQINAVGRIKCRLEAPDSVLVEDPLVADHLYRIAQEATNNAIKHARARSIVIRLTRTRDILRLEIADDGTGMSKGEVDQRGVGLRVMQHRASVIGATLDVESKRGHGVTIRCSFPLKK
jgi:signal transduction histidine kinase